MEQKSKYNQIDLLVIKTKLKSKFSFSQIGQQIWTFSKIYKTVW